MAIDIKSILGTTKSTIMTPSEIADLALRKRSLAMQRENLEYNRTAGAIGNVFNNIGALNTQEEISGAQGIINSLEGEVDDPTLKAQLTLTQSALSDNQAKVNRVNELESKFNTFEGNEFDRVLDGEIITANDLRNNIKNFRAVSNELNSEELSGFVSGKFRARIDQKMNDYSILQRSLINNGILDKEEADMYIQAGGNDKLFAQKMEATIAGIKSEFAVNSKRLDRVNSNMGRLNEAMLASATGEFSEQQIFASTEAMKEQLENEGIDTSGANTLDEYSEILMQYRDEYENINDQLNERNMFWEGVPLFTKPDIKVKDLGLDSDWVDKNEDGIHDNSGLNKADHDAKYSQIKPEKEVVKVSDKAKTEGGNFSKIFKVVTGAGVVAGVAKGAVPVAKAVTNMTKETWKAVKYMNSQFKLDAKQIENIYKDRTIRRGYEDIDNANTKINEIKKNAKKIRGIKESKRTIAQVSQLKSYDDRIKFMTNQKDRVEKKMFNHFSKKYNIKPEDIKRMIDNKDKWYAPKYRDLIDKQTGKTILDDAGKPLLDKKGGLKKVTRRMTGKFTKATGTLFTGQMINDMLNIETESGIMQLGADIATGTAAVGATKYTAGKVFRQIIKPHVWEKLKPVLTKIAPKLATKIGAGITATLIPEGVSTAVGLGMLGWSIYDLISYAKDYPQVREALGLDIPE